VTPVVRPIVAATAAPAAAEDETGPRMSMRFRGLGRTLKVKLGCPSDEKQCSGRLAIRLDESTLKSVVFTLRGGQTEQLAIGLSRGQRRMLRHAGVFDLKATASDQAGNRQVRELSFQL
jgi:hypothetical protein